MKIVEIKFKPNHLFSKCFLLTLFSWGLFVFEKGSSKREVVYWTWHLKEVSNYSIFEIFPECLLGAGSQKMLDAYLNFYGNQFFSDPTFNQRFSIFESIGQYWLYWLSKISY